jgi:uncharacterized metal-binding protein YceD (DUF177 family)
MYITIDRKVITIDENRTDDELKRIRNAIRAQERKLRQIEADKMRRGFCPDCHVLLTVSGKCSKCQSVWRFHKTHH